MAHSDALITLVEGLAHSDSEEGLLGELAMRLQAATGADACDILVREASALVLRASTLEPE